MADARIKDAKLTKLSNPISALDDEPELDAEDLKAYFDASPTELMEKHNALITALTSRNAATDIGFNATENIPRSSIQEAIEYVRAHSGSGSSTSVGDGTISRASLDSDLISELDGYAAMETTVTSLNTKVTALEQQVSSSTGSGTIAAGSISRDMLDDDLAEELDGYAVLEHNLSVLSVKLSSLSDRVTALEGA